MAALSALIAAEQVVDKDWLTAAGASFLTVAVATLAIVLIFGRKETRPWLRTILYLLTFGLAALALTFFYAANKQDKSTGQVVEDAKAEVLDKCLPTLNTLGGLVSAKLITVNSAEEAKAIAEQMKAVIDNTACKADLVTR